MGSRRGGGPFLPNAFPSGKLWPSSRLTRVAGIERAKFAPVSDKIVPLFLFAAHIIYTNHIRGLLHAAKMYAGKVFADNAQRKQLRTRKDSDDGGKEWKARYTPPIRNVAAQDEK